MQKTVLITGASSGIGKETAYAYAEKKYNLILVARRKEKLETIKKEIEEKYKTSVTIFDIDLSKTDSAELLYKKTTENSLKVDILINNAGFGINGQFKDIDMDREEGMLILNMVTLTKLTKLYLKNMLLQEAGHIINIASTAAFQGIPGFATYAATKAYVLHFSEALSVELENTNVKITTICPGATQSEFADTANVGNKNLFSKAPTSRNLAEFTYLSMKKGEVTAIHGLKNKIMVFTSKFSPRQLVTKIAGKMMK